MNGHAAVHRGGDGSSGGSAAGWDALLGISPAAWAASVLRTPQLLRQRAFKCKTLEDCLEVGTAAFAAPLRCPQRLAARDLTMIGSLRGTCAVSVRR